MRLSRKSHARTATAAGLTIGAVGAALLVAPQAAFAAITVAPSTVVAPGTAGLTITDTTNGSGTPFTTGDASKVELLTGTVTTCPVKYSATSATIVAATTSTSSTTVVTFTLPAGVTANANGQVKKWIACVYSGNVAGTSDLQGSTTGYTYMVGTPPTASPAVGPIGGGNTITVTAGAGGPIFTGVTTPAAIFTLDACPATYGTPAAGTGVAGTKTSDSVATFTVPATVANTTVGPTPYNVCIYSAGTSAAGNISMAQYGVSLLNLSQNTGPYGGGNGLNVTATTEFLAGIDTPGAVFKAGDCPATYTETNSSTVKFVPTANVRKLTNSRLALTMPQFYTTAANFTTAYPSGSGVWNMCIYNGQEVGTSTPVYSTQYTITTVPYATKITPSAGPALGGRRITVTGVALPITAGALTATLGGTPLNDIQVINANAFTAVTPMHAPANNVALVLTTAAGSSTLSNAYSYTSTLIATPNTAPNTRAVDVIVNGVGFQSPAWNTGLGGAHIYLVQGKYESTETGGNRAVTPDAECTNVLPLTDTELICTLALNKRLNAAGTATLAAAYGADTSMTTVLGTRVVTTTAVAKTDIGMVITNNSNLPAGTTIVDVLDATHFIASANPTGAGADATSNIVPWDTRSVSVGGLSGGGADVTLTSTPGVFTSADVGKWINGVTTDIAAGTKITAVNTTTGDITIDTAVPTAYAGGGTTTVSVGSTTLPVPEGPYNLTFVSNGTGGASVSDQTYVQSVISSASTFTVSAF